MASKPETADRATDNGHPERAAATPASAQDPGQVDQAASLANTRDASHRPGRAGQGQ